LVAFLDQDAGLVFKSGYLLFRFLELAFGAG